MVVSRLRHRWSLCRILPFVHPIPQCQQA